MKYLAAYGVALVTFLIVDGLWLGVVARSFYVERIGHLLLDQPRWGIAALFYAVYIVGLVYFAVTTGFNSGGTWVAALNGGLFGLFAYMTYNFTNLSTMKGYDGLIAVVDTSWGAVNGALVSFITVFILSRLGIGNVD